MDIARLNNLRTIAADFRDAIERSRAEHATPALPYFPEGACRLTSRLFALHLMQRASGPIEGLRFCSGHVPGQEPYVRHTWLAIDDVIVDLTADPFGKAPVVVGALTAFHASLEAHEAQQADALLASLSSDERSRLARLLLPIEARLPGCRAI